MEIPRSNERQPSRGAADEQNKLLIPLGYTAFVGLPTIGAIIFFIWFSNRPAQVKVETEPAVEEQTTTIPKAQSPHETKKRPVETKRKDSSEVSTSSSAESKHISESNTGVAVLDLPKADSPLPMNDTSATGVIIAPPPRMIEYGTLKLIAPAPVSRDVVAWLDVDGKRVATWEAKQTIMETKLLVGHHSIKIFSIYKNTKHTIFEAEVDISLDQVTQLPVQPKK